MYLYNLVRILIYHYISYHIANDTLIYESINEYHNIKQTISKRGVLSFIIIK